MNRLTSIILTFVVCLIAAGAGTYFALPRAVSKKTDQARSSTELSPTISPKAISSPIPSVKPSQIPVASPTPIAKRTAKTNDLVHLRADKSTSSAILIDLQGGTTVVLGNDETPQWQAVTYGSYSGYVWKTYLIY